MQRDNTDESEASKLHVVEVTFLSLKRELEYTQKELAVCRKQCAELIAANKRKRKVKPKQK